MNGYIMDGWMDGWMEGGMDLWTDGWMDGRDGQTDGWMDYFSLCFCRGVIERPSQLSS